MDLVVDISKEHGYEFGGKSLQKPCKDTKIIFHHVCSM
jgi:hypothetical protein